MEIFNPLIINWLIEPYCSFIVIRVEKLKKKLHLAGFHREKIEKLEGYFVAKEEFLNAALKTMKEEYGSINQFMIKGLNISMQQKEDFKQKVLE